MIQKGVSQDSRTYFHSFGLLSFLQVLMASPSRGVERIKLNGGEERGGHPGKEVVPG